MRIVGVFIEWISFAQCSAMRHYVLVEIVRLPG
jgi:hypothetical protein